VLECKLPLRRSQDRRTQRAVFGLIEVHTLSHLTACSMIDTMPVASQCKSAWQWWQGDSEAARQTQLAFITPQNLIVQAASAALAPVIVTAAVGAVGFTAGGIAANSAASSLMASYGGAVGAGTACATLQSIGAAGLSTASTVALSATGAVTGSAGFAAVTRFFRGSAAAAPGEQDAADAPLVDEPTADPTVPVDDAGDPDVPPLGAVYV
jgi:Interferon-induced 6-16 family